MQDKHLARLRQQAIDRLYEPTNDSRMSFYSPQDTLNVSTRELFKAIVITPREACELMSEEWIMHTIPRLTGKIGLDVETEGFNWWEHKTLGIGLSFACYNERYNNYFLDCRGADESHIITILNRLNPYVTWVLHNAKFDLKWLRAKYGFIPQLFEDTLVMGYVLFAGTDKPLALDKLANEYLNRYPWTLSEYLKVDKKHITPELMRSIPIDWLGDYCVEDCYETLLMYWIFSEMLTESYTIYETDNDFLPHSLWNIYEIDRDSILPIIECELNGITLKTELIEELLEDTTLEQELIAEEIQIETGKDIEFTSSEKLSTFIYQDLKVPTKGIKQGKKGFHSVDKNSLADIEDYHPLIPQIIKYRELESLKTKFLGTLPNHCRDGNKIYTTLNNTVTDTGRLSCSNPNLQQIPSRSPLGKKIRKAFIASPGHILLDCDFSQFELRIIAHMSNESLLLDAFLKGSDPHAATSIKLFGINYDPENPEHQKLRFIGKTINFGIVYGMGEHRLYNVCLSAGMSVTLNWCKKVLEDYWSAASGIANMLARFKLQAISRGYSETYWGRRRHFQFQGYELLNMGKELSKEPIENFNHEVFVEVERVCKPKPQDAGMLRASGNHPIQGTNADAVRKAMYDLYRRTEGTTFRLLLQIHDELIGECPIGNEDMHLWTMVDCMESSIDLCVPVKVSSSVANSWGECK